VPAGKPSAKIDVAAVRRRTGLSQSQFAGRFGFNLRTVQEWEQGRSTPDSAARAYLLVIDRQPKAVERALRAN
jgi:putative transcriptional regulator